MSDKPKLYRYKHPDDPNCWIADTFTRNGFTYHTLNSNYGIPVVVRSDAFEREYEPVPVEQANGGWKKIDENTPKEREIILFSHRRRDFIAIGQWAFAEPAINAVEGWFWPYNNEPTHWREMPKPPEREGDGA